jgi:quercetin dioxygenase-like cupin family protein
MQALFVWMLFAPFVLLQQASATLKNYTPLFENDEVRVGRVTLPPGESEGLHVHPYPRVLICLEGATIEVKRRDGSIAKTVYRPGDAIYQTDTQPHEPVNVSTSRFVGVVVELKSQLPSRSPQNEKLDSLDPLVAAPGFHKLVFENDRIRILDVRNKPGDFEPLHKHARSVLTILEGGTARFGLPDGSTKVASFSASANPPAGEPPQVFWEDAATHSVANVGTTPIHLVRVELK